MFRLGRRRESLSFRVLVASSPVETSRLGLVVSRRVGKAHRRNWFKRRIREYFRVRRLELGNAVDVVVMVKPGAAPAGTAAITRELDSCLAQWLAAPR